MNRAECLHAAEGCVCADRNQQYGEPEDNFRVISDLWTIYLTARCTASAGHVDLGPEEVADLMVLFKVGRNASALEPRPDTYVDMAGYAACGCEIATGGRAAQAPDDLAERKKSSKGQEARPIEDWTIREVMAECANHDGTCEGCRILGKDGCKFERPPEELKFEKGN